MNYTKPIIFSTILSMASLSVTGQIAHWVIEPSFDDVKTLSNGLIEAKVGNKSGLYTSKGEPVLPFAYDSIGTYTDNEALLFNNSRFAGFINSEGRLIDLSDARYKLVPDQDFFSDGFLSVMRDGKYYFLNRDGQEVAGPFAEIHPYSDGFAATRYYVDLFRKPDETNLAYINSDLLFTHIPEFGKPDDLSFISSFREGKAICVYKKKAYFLTKNLTVSPISVDSTATKKSIISFDNKSVIPQTTENGFVIYAKNAVLTFNKQLQLDKIESGENLLYSYAGETSVPKNISSEFSEFEKDGKYGLTYGGTVVLPAQFSAVKLLDGKYALVKLDGKWGIITIDPHNHFQFKLNDNEHIGFNHRFYITKLAALMPSYIKCNNTTVYSKSPDCEIQIESRNEIENIECNTLTYDCKLSITSSLSDTLATHEYTYALKYNGLQSIDYKVSIPEWYVKYYEVELSNTKFTVNSNDTITVEFDLVKTDAARNDDTNYFKTVELITPENENIPLNKITENHYSFRIGSGDRERLTFVVKITENGCPSIEYPFEMVFTKSASKSKNKSVDVIVNPVKTPEPKPIFVPK